MASVWLLLLLLLLLPDRLLRERIRKSRSAQALDHLEEWDMWEGQDLVPLDRWAGRLQESTCRKRHLQDSLQESLQDSRSLLHCSCREAWEAHAGSGQRVLGVQKQQLLLLLCYSPV
jgi:hypothetical protein